ncbi:MAG: glucan biosynthesis protein C [Cryomorphaceae bacterium]|jgi:glucan biosynthesis protein C
MHNSLSVRRHDVDWLRVLAFITLIFYHIGMFYVADWGWHVKSQYQSEFLQYFMLLVNQWRMPLIFFISGFALCMVEGKFSARKIVSIRFYRVLIPLILGMYLIVPPQVYYEAIAKLSYSGSYWTFWLDYIDADTTLLPDMHHSPLGMLTWNHLWYLAYLWCYTLVYLVIKPILTRVGSLIQRSSINSLCLVLVPVGILTVYGLWLKPLFPKTNALTDDWYNHAVYFSVFLFGYFAAKSELIWQTIIRDRRIWLGVAVVCYLLLMVLNKTDWLNLYGPVWSVLIQACVYTNMWLWILAVIGFSGAHLNKSSATLSYLNEAILPLYILHQSVTIIIAANLSQLLLGGAVEACILVLGTFATCAVLYELIRRWKPTRFIFGMKLNRS